MNDVVPLQTFRDPRSLRQTEIEFDPRTNSLYLWMKPSPRPCFNLEILAESADFEGGLELRKGWFNFDGQECLVENAVLGSRIPGIYNLGGDLELFVAAILKRDRAALANYGHACINSVYRRALGYNSGVTTYALVQGRAFGGGFECALASEVIVAEESATFSFPEILFNLIPGMGAVSLLGRRVGLPLAEKIMMSGEVYSARQMQKLGVVDELAPDGEGLAATRHLIEFHRRRQNARRALSLAKREFQAISKTEMQNIVEIWVDAALSLENRDLRLMSRLARAQDRLIHPDGDSGLNVDQI